MQEKINKFTKKDLKVEDIVTLACGLKGIVLPNCICLLKTKTQLNLDYYTNDLKSKLFLEALEIVKVERTMKLDVIYEKGILDDVEKRYLKNFLNPFRKKVKYIQKIKSPNPLDTYLFIQLADKEKIDLPNFNINEMYLGMELDKQYTLEELGI